MIWLNGSCGGIVGLYRNVGLEGERGGGWISRMGCCSCEYLLSTGGCVDVSFPTFCCLIVDLELRRSANV